MSFHFHCGSPSHCFSEDDHFFSGFLVCYMMGWSWGFGVQLICPCFPCLLSFILDPAVICPSVPETENNTIRFATPTLVNFPHEELVKITYWKNGLRIGTFSTTVPYHELDDFEGGTNVVTAEASDSKNGVTAACYFLCYRIPGIYLLETLN